MTIEQYKAKLADRNKKITKLVAESHANKGTQKELDALRAADDKRKTDALSETEKETKRANDAEAERDAAIARADRQERLLVVKDGKSKDIQELLEMRLVKWRAENPDTGDDVFMTEQREKNPEFFRTDKPPLDVAGGAQNKGTGEIAKVKQRIEELSKKALKTPEDRVRLMRLRAELSRLSG
ncbi:MAG: hypothetical protein DRP64_18095 [Verrucomicrobia bacterium]|nr:MAG: hypothetical protein DRP64_18095 [Verrucomicrobiota bacterium]